MVNLSWHKTQAQQDKIGSARELISSVNLKLTGSAVESEGAMGNLLDAPKTEKDSHYFADLSGYEIGASGMQGWRLEQEDAHIVAAMPSQPDHVMVAVFDGHGGAGASLWASKNLVEILEARIEWKEYTGGDQKNLGLLCDALRNAFLDADVALRKFQASGHPEADTSGCTAVVCMVTPDTIVCANAGDSRAVLATNGKTREMSFDHKPFNNLERTRIEKAGGTVQFNRVDGDLAVSRAFGDFQYKTSPELPAEQQKVSPEPDIITHDRVDVDEFLLLACDGLYDVMSNAEATGFGRQILQEGESNMTLMAEEMLDIALEKDSRDNISAIVVKLPGIQIATGGGGVMARRKIKEAARAVEQAEVERTGVSAK